MARSTFFFSCSTLVLPFLVLSSPVTTPNTCRWPELHSRVEKLKTLVKSCSDNCSVPVTFPPRDTCDCFNVSVPSTNGSASSYFIKALESTHSTIHSNYIIQHLKWQLEDCSKHILVSVTYEPVLSPVALYQKLQNLSQELNS